ncbi:MAG TPA: mechanosensitive ion channel domain-containing protein, partial [Clostridia bacterium]|nr:mechanosensitive ion channel domain-containing protein [Clostridia bacterium]
MSMIWDVFINFLFINQSTFWIIIKAFAVIILSIIFVKIGSIIINKAFEKQKKFRFSISSRKLNTLSALVIRVLKYGVYIIAGVIILSDLFNVKSVLAAAGIGGVALGFGAQSLVRDVISGFFIIIEDQFAVGDMITIDEMTGTVEQIELRISRIRNSNGDLHIIPNGEIKKVTNHSRGNKAAIIDIPIAYSSNMNKVLEIASRICEEFKYQDDVIIEAPKVVGITE